MKKEEKFTTGYTKAVPKQLKYNNDSYFTQQFTNKIREILSEIPPDKFRKTPMPVRRELFNRLQILLETETLWKDLVQKSKHDWSVVKETYPKENQQYIKLFNEGFYVPDSVKKKNVKQKYGSEKAKNFFKGLVKYLSLKPELAVYSNVTEDVRLSLTEEDYERMLCKIEPEIIFREIVKICMKKAYDSTINIEHSNHKRFHTEPVGEDFLKAKRTHIQYTLRRFIQLYLTVVVLETLMEIEKLDKKEEENITHMLQYLDDYFKKNLHFEKNVKKNSWFLEADIITIISLSFFERTSVVKSVEMLNTRNESQDAKSIVFVFDHRLDNSVSYFEHIPRVVPPAKAETKDNIRDWISPIKDGKSNVLPSDEAVLALNIAQKKEFVINTTFLELLKEIFDVDREVKEFPTRKVIRDKEFQLSSWEVSPWISGLNRIIYLKTEKYVKVSKTHKNLELKERHRQIVHMSDITHAECYATVHKNRLREDLVKMKSLRKMLLTSFTIAELFEGYPLYYSTLLDYRLRMYPLQNLLSRTTGYLKNLLQEHKPRKLTAKGYRNMLEAYYSPSPEQLSEFRRIKENDKQKYRKFFSENPLLEISEKPIYFSLLHKELHRVLHETGRSVSTSLPLEIGQVGSRPTLVALVTGNKVLAEKCNLLGGEFSCVYTFLMGLSESFLDIILKEEEIRRKEEEKKKLEEFEKREEEIKRKEGGTEEDIMKLKEDIKKFKEKNIPIAINEETKKSFDLLTTNRKAHKYALMCFMYNEQHRSRTSRWTDLFEEEYGIGCSQENFGVLRLFSVQYERFLELAFPKLTKQLDLINQAMLTIVNLNSIPVQISTLDGCIINWDFDHVDSKKLNYYNSVTNHHSQFRVNVVMAEPTQSSKTKRTNRHLRSFRPNLMHSIDGSIMRFFISEFFKKTKGRRLNHLHDCVMLHPNDVDIFYELAEELYCDPKMLSLANDLVFERFKKDTVGPPRR